MMPRAMLVRCAFLTSAAMLATLGGCSGWVANSGPSERQIAGAMANPETTIPLIDIDPRLALRLAQAEKHQSFADEFPRRSAHGDYVLGAGDIVEVSVWESPPAVLFGSATMLDPRKG